MEQHVDLGHAKRNKSFLRQVEQFINNKSCLTKSNMADMMSSYRYAGNENISIADARKIRQDFILSQCADNNATLLINDVSLLQYQYHDSKLDRRSIGDGKGKGYEYVCNLAVSLEDERPLGVIHDCLISAEGPADSDVVDYHSDEVFDKLRAENKQGLECNHKHQLVCHSRYIREQAGEKSFIMTADREFDDHFFFEECVPGKFDCVIRSAALRSVQICADYDWIPDCAKTCKYSGLPKKNGFIIANMKELVKHVPTVDYKMLPLDKKGRHTDSESATSWAELSIGAFEVMLYRDAKRNKTYFKAKTYIKLNVVVIKENNPPSDREAICWVLFTTLAIDTLDDLIKIGRIYELRWLIGVSSQGHITKSVKVRPGIKDSCPVAWEVPLREIKMVKPSDNVFTKENMQHTRPQRTVNADVASLHVNPVAETVYYARRHQGLTERNLKRQFSPAGYQRWHGVNGYVETGEALDIRRRNPVEEAEPITLNGKWISRYQGGGSGCSTDDRRAAKRAGREGPGPMSNPCDQREVVAG